MQNSEVMGTLKDGQVLLGHFYDAKEDNFPEFGHDWPFAGYRFEATPQFSRFRALFDSLLAAGEAEDWVQEERCWREINSLQLGLELNTVNKKLVVRAPIDGEKMSLFENPKNAALFIDNTGKKAWFRLW